MNDEPADGLAADAASRVDGPRPGGRRRPSRLPRAQAVGALLAAVSLAAACSRSYSIDYEPPGLTDGDTIEAWLDGSSYLPFSLADGAVGVIVPIPTSPANVDRASMRRVPDHSLRPAGLRPAAPRDALGRAGTYAGVFALRPQASGDSTYFVDRVGDPRRLLGERPGRVSIEGRGVDVSDGMLAVRVPWVENARFAVFEVDESRDVVEVFLQIDFGTSPPSPRASWNSLK